MKNQINIIFALLWLMTMACDLEKLTSYDHTAAPIPDSARLYGTILNKFTLEPVVKARIGIASQFTYTDENGEFTMYYHLGEDDARNKPVTVSLSAENYMSLDTNLIVFPENELSKKLVYGAPVIRRIALVDSICQAEIYDYQGAEDIARVSGSFTYRLRPMDRQISLHREISLIRVAVDTPNTAYYQGTIDTYLVEFGDLQPTYFIDATDRNSHLTTATSSAVGQDSLIFPPVR
ncbi:MAG: hypothetical protein E4H13_10525 [Calditrichales bacterium]|nr:MAG: hypothetical protein E4H13_10525 [Calditrichales bacterium]